jgi:phosphohistidine phosphatase
MRVLIVRHAPAEDRQVFARSGQSDNLRPLSRAGKEKMSLNIKGLQKIILALDGIAESPLVRAQQTADYLASAYPKAIRETLPALAPNGNYGEILKYLQQYTHTNKTIALVGHEPDLGELATWLLTGEAENWMPLKKGSACLLEFFYEVDTSQAELCWMLQPKQLRQLAR